VPPANFASSYFSRQSSTTQPASKNIYCARWSNGGLAEDLFRSVRRSANTRVLCFTTLVVIHNMSARRVFGNPGEMTKNDENERERRSASMRRAVKNRRQLQRTARNGNGWQTPRKKVWAKRNFPAILRFILRFLLRLQSQARSNRFEFSGSLA
jgi:hypothetical protein